MKNMKKTFSLFALAAWAACSLQSSAGNIDATAARAAASQFLQRHSAGTLMAPTPANLILSHTEASTAVAGANDYYVFNIKGGGFIIIAGEDRATEVLGYSDKGMIDINNLPFNLQGLLNGFKHEIEFLQTYEGDDLIPAPKSFKATSGVAPLIKTTWGQEDPYDWQCPVYQGLYCAVGCVATAMAQVMNYWQYPEGSAAISGYYCQKIRKNIPALPATTFDYSLMLNSYCHWDWNTSTLVQDTYTTAQGQEVAKLSRYCGQAVEMQYHPDGSGAYTRDECNAMIDFGYRSSAQYIQKSGNGGWWTSDNYTTAQWESMLKTELDAGRPVLYSADDSSGGAGHAFICDGYDTDGKFHFNFGWYGTCDGWYVSTALNMTHRDGDYLQFNSGHEMVIGVEPPAGWQPPVQILLGDVDMDGVVGINDATVLIDYLLNGDSAGIDLEAADMDDDGNVAIADVTAIIDYLLANGGAE